MVRGRNSKGNVRFEGFLETVLFYLGACVILCEDGEWVVFTSRAARNSGRMGDFRLHVLAVSTTLRDRVSFILCLLRCVNACVVHGSLMFSGNFIFLILFFLFTFEAFRVINVGVRGGHIRRISRFRNTIRLFIRKVCRRDEIGGVRRGRKWFVFRSTRSILYLLFCV